jgi:integrase
MAPRAGTSSSTCPHPPKAAAEEAGLHLAQAAPKSERDSLAAFSERYAGRGPQRRRRTGDLAELDVQETTVANYRDLIRCYVTPHIGSRQLYTVDKRVLHDLYRTLEQRGGRDGKPLSRTTVGTAHRVLMKAFRDLGIQLDGVRKPRPAQRETRGRKGAWTPAECVQFLDHHAEHRLRAAWVLAIVVGVRRGELAGLKWHRVDLDKGILYVHWQRTATSAGIRWRTAGHRAARVRVVR